MTLIKGVVAEPGGLVVPNKVSLSLMKITSISYFPVRK